MNKEESIYTELNKKSLEWYTDSLLHATISYNKAILSLSIAVLGFIFGYIKLGTHKIEPLCLLIFIWILLISSILCIISSILLEQFQTEHYIKYIYNQLIPDKNININRDYWAHTLIRGLTIISGVFLVISLILFAIFVGLNIKS